MEEDFDLTTSELTNYLKNTPVEPSTSKNVDEEKAKKAAARKRAAEIAKQKKKDKKQSSDSESDVEINMTPPSTKRLQSAIASAASVSTKGGKFGAIKKTFEIAEPPSKFKVNLSTQKEFKIKTLTVNVPFFCKHELNLKREVDAAMNCVCGQPMVVKGEQYICPRSDNPCPYVVTVKAFLAILEKEYVDPKIGLKQGIVLPVCNQCKYWSITTGGAFYGMSTIVMRCGCSRRNIKAIMCRGSTYDASIEKMCKSGFWKYDNLPLQVSCKLIIILSRDKYIANFFSYK